MVTSDEFLQTTQTFIATKNIVKKTTANNIVFGALLAGDCISSRSRR